jgi:hypothetical protein
MNRYRTTGVPTAAAMHRSAFSFLARFENNADNIGQLPSVRRRLPGVNRNQKGWRRQSAESRLRAFGATNPANFRIRAMLARVKYGNGDLAWR